jgi:hypothetical protein
MTPGILSRNGDGDHLEPPDDRKVTFVELFFDLVFVFCVTKSLVDRCRRALPDPVPSDEAGSATAVERAPEAGPTSSTIARRRRGTTAWE